MKRLCFGVLLKTMTLCTPHSVKNKRLCEVVLASVNDAYAHTIDDTAVSNLLRCKRNLSADITDAAIKADTKDVQAYIQANVLPLFDMNKANQFVLAIRDILTSDTTIDATTLIGKESGYEKQNILTAYNFDFAGLLANVFLYTAVHIKNTEGDSCIGEIADDYIDSFSDRKNEVSLCMSPINTATSIPKTIKGKNFNNIFTEIPHTGSLGLLNPNQLRIFHLDVMNNEFHFSALKNFLLNNIGRYVFSRAQMEQFKTDDEIENIGLHAVRLMSADNSGTGDELGEVLLYALLEQVLGAPKILSKIELEKSSNQFSSKSDGVHLLSLDDSGTPYYQFVFGASSIIGDIKGAFDKAVISIENVKQESENEMQLIEGTVFNNVFDKETTEYMKQLLVPSKNKTEAPDMAFGVFLGYSLGLDKTQYSNRDFRSALTDKMAKDIQDCASYIAEEIKKLSLDAYSFYFYVIPFNDAIEDKKNIMNDLLVGGATL